MLETAISSQMTQGQTLKQQNLENKNGKKNNCIDISSDKQVKSHMRRLGNG